MDCSIIPTKLPGIYVISTVDFFYPLVPDPHLQGRIGCCNVLSDLYAMGVVDCDNILMCLASSLDMSETERNIVSRAMIEGFNQCAREAETIVSGGQSILNPWPIIGGVAMSVCKKEQFIVPENAVPGDVLVLTKPIGTQVAVNFFQWTGAGREDRWAKVSDQFTKDDAIRAFGVACESMSRLNRNGARLMHKYGAHAGTDVTGFGLLGHARNLAKNQKAAVRLEIHTLPLIKNMREVNEKVKIWKLLEGLSAETSGGLLVALPAENAESFVKEISELDKQPAWIVGKVVLAEDGVRDAVIASDPIIVEV